LAQAFVIVLVLHRRAARGEKLMGLWQYGRWDGSQQIEPFTAEDLMDHLADRILDDRDLLSSLREMMQRGADLRDGRRMPGLRDLLEQLRQQRQQQLQRYNMGSVMDDIKEQLEQVKQTEREGIQKRLEDQNQPGSSDASLQEMLKNFAEKHLDQLDNLPPGVGAQIQQLRDYDFMDPEARQQFEELLQTLQKQILEQTFQGLKQGLGAMTPEKMKQVQEMVRDLNELLENHRLGDDSGFQDFMEKWGEFFPPGIENVEQLAEHMQQQMAAMQSLMDSMTPEMRRELEDMLDQLFQDGGLQQDLARLMMNLDRMFPGQRGDGMPFTGDEPVSLQEAMRMMGDMRGLEELEQELLEAVRRNDVSSLDTDEIGRLMGDEARRMAQELQDFMQMLEDAGLIRRRGRDWELTPRAMRKIGERALEDIFGRIDRGLAGDHSLGRSGWGVERLDETKPFVFGDPFDVDMHGTLKNALRREGAGTPVRLAMDDFEVYQSSTMNQCSTVIMLDMSYSMLRRGRFQAGRKVALALDSLIRSKFPRDELHTTAFSYFVLPLQPHQLLDDYWIDPRGTDFPEALRAGRAILGKRKGGTKQIILITDGEPHANSAGWGSYYENGWNMRQAMEDTLREVSRCTREGIIVNTFMLDTEPVITQFVKTLTRINSGRIFFADPTQLGEYLIVDYMKNRRRAS
jgi:uncharacterized protein with von Willebrand factor type A (vWA) domain